MTQISTEFYKELLDRMSDGVYFVDRDRRILYWNEGATRLTGYKPEEIVGQYCYDNTLCHVDGTGHQLCHDGCPLSACLGDGGRARRRCFSTPQTGPASSRERTRATDSRCQRHHRWSGRDIQ